MVTPKKEGAGNVGKNKPQEGKGKALSGDELKKASGGGRGTGGSTGGGAGRF